MSELLDRAGSGTAAAAAAPPLSRTRSSLKNTRAVPLADSPHSNTSDSAPASQDSKVNTAATLITKSKGKKRAVGIKAKANATASSSKAPEDVAYEYVPVAQMKAENRKNLSYHLSVRQQPMAARMCGVGEKADRRPLDPTPVIQLQVMDTTLDPSQRKLRRPKRAGQNFTQNPYYFCFACLVSGEPDATDDELHVVDNGKQRSLTGTPVSSLYHLKDLDNQDAAFFVFPDLGVRKEGRYRLKMTVYEIVDHRYVHFCDSIFTDAFTVFSAKKFPGMSAPTALSQAFQEQGLKIRVRKQTKVQMAKNKRKADMDAMALYAESAKRSRPPPPMPARGWESRRYLGGHPHGTGGVGAGQGQGPPSYMSNPRRAQSYGHGHGMVAPMAPPPLPPSSSIHRPLSSPQAERERHALIPHPNYHRPSTQPDFRQHPGYPPQEYYPHPYAHAQRGPEPPRVQPHPQHHHMYGPAMLSRPGSGRPQPPHDPVPVPVPEEYQRPPPQGTEREREREITGWPRPLPPLTSAPAPAPSRGSVEASEGSGSVTSGSGSYRDPYTPISRAPSSQRSFAQFPGSGSGNGSRSSVTEDEPRIKAEPSSGFAAPDAGSASAPVLVEERAVKPTGRMGLSDLLQ